jgi:hypothetical protein
MMFLYFIILLLLILEEEMYDDVCVDDGFDVCIMTGHGGISRDKVINVLC